MTGDPFIGLARASAVTTTLKLGTGICLVPEHHPLLLAKEIALDHLSNGRFLFGIGAVATRRDGDHGGQFPASMGSNQGSQVMKEIWTKDEAEFHGNSTIFRRSVRPKPSRKPPSPDLPGGIGQERLQAWWHGGWLDADRAIPEDIKMPGCPG